MMNEYDGHWISTQHVPKFHFLKPTSSEIDIRDIAHSLALTCRFGGHCSRYYSVAEHSVRVSMLVDDKSKLSALLHDAAEAYVPDIPSPIKYVTPEFSMIYKNLEEAILLKFDAYDADWALIKNIDKRLCALEAKEFKLWNKDWQDLGQPLKIDSKLFGWGPKRAEHTFMEAFREYTVNRTEAKSA